MIANSEVSAWRSRTSGAAPILGCRDCCCAFQRLNVGQELGLLDVRIAKKGMTAWELQRQSEDKPEDEREGSPAGVVQGEG